MPSYVSLSKMLKSPTFRVSREYSSINLGVFTVREVYVADTTSAGKPQIVTLLLAGIQRLNPLPEIVSSKPPA